MTTNQTCDILLLDTLVFREWVDRALYPSMAEKPVTVERDEGLVRKRDGVITCSAIDCKRTRKTHPVNFRGIRNGIPLCQAHYIQKNKVGFTEFSPIRKSGKLQMKYEKRLKTNSHPCECGRPFNSLQSLHSHKTYLSPKYRIPKCNH